MKITNVPWTTIGKYALVLAVGALGGGTAVQNQKAPVTSSSCPACAPVLNCPAVQKPSCDITVNGVRLK